MRVILGFLLQASRKGERLDKDLIVKEENQVQWPLSTSFKRGTDGSEIVVRRWREQNTRRNEGFTYLRPSVTVPTARACFLTPFQQLARTVLPNPGTNPPGWPAVFLSLLVLPSDSDDSNSQSWPLNAKTPSPHPALCTLPFSVESWSMTLRRRCVSLTTINSKSSFDKSLSLE